MMGNIAEMTSEPDGHGHLLGDCDGGGSAMNAYGYGNGYVCTGTGDYGVSFDDGCGYGAIVGFIDGSGADNYLDTMIGGNGVTISYNGPLWV